MVNQDQSNCGCSTEPTREQLEKMDEIKGISIDILNLLDGKSVPEALQIIKTAESMLRNAMQRVFNVAVVSQLNDDVVLKHAEE